MYVCTEEQMGNAHLLTAVSGIEQPPAIPMRRPSTGGCAERAGSTSLPHEDHASTAWRRARQDYLFRGAGRVSGSWSHGNEQRGSRACPTNTSIFRVITSVNILL